MQVYTQAVNKTGLMVINRIGTKKAKKSRADLRREAELRALHAETKLQEKRQILKHLALPPSRRTHFLRVKLPGGGSCL